jgi:biopolymer transport protein ExbD
MPRRSVTRFFIPLIDVLILLFCIFLLMPFVSAPDEREAQPSPVKEPELPKDAQELQRQLNEARRRIDRLLKDRSSTAEKLSVRVLDIDKATGRLYAFDPDSKDPRIEIRDQGDAQRLIDRQRRLAGAKDPFFLILYPRELTGYPLQKQVDQYRHWFRDVPHGFDNPWTEGL